MVFVLTLRARARRSRTIAGAHIRAAPQSGGAGRRGWTALVSGHVAPLEPVPGKPVRALEAAPAVRRPQGEVNSVNWVLVYFLLCGAGADYRPPVTPACPGSTLYDLGLRRRGAPLSFLSAVQGPPHLSPHLAQCWVLLRHTGAQRRPQVHGREGSCIKALQATRTTRIRFMTCGASAQCLGPWVPPDYRAESWPESGGRHPESSKSRRSWAKIGLHRAPTAPLFRAAAGSERPPSCAQGAAVAQWPVGGRTAFPFRLWSRVSAPPPTRTLLNESSAKWLLSNSGGCSGLLFRDRRGEQ